MKTPAAEVIQFKRSWVSLIPHFIFGLLICIFGLIVTVELPGSVLHLRIPLGGFSFTLPLPLFLLLALFVLARPIVLLFDSRFEISNHHLRIIRGQLSLWLRKQEFAFEDLLGVQVTQSIIERLLGVGSVRVGSKTSSIEVVMRGIRNPEKIAAEVSKRIDTSRIAEKARANAY